MGNMLRAKIAVLTLAFGLIALTPVSSQASIADPAAERGTRTSLQPAAIVAWDLSGLFSLLRSGR